jgi:DNA-directed RNA polymerase specialized sigma subunit
MDTPSFFTHIGSYASCEPVESHQNSLMDEALRRLEQFDERKGQIVMLRYFAGLSIDETANSLEICRLCPSPTSRARAK